MDERLRRWTLAPNKSPRPVGFPPLHPACPASGDNIFLTLRHSRLPLVVQGPHLSTKLLVVSQVGQVRANNLSSESSTIKSVPPILSHRLQYCSSIIYLYRVCLSLRLSQTAINSRHVQSAMLVPGWSQSEPITKVNWTPGCASLKLHNLEHWQFYHGNVPKHHDVCTPFQAMLSDS